jgi:hypothetical protein
MTVTDETEQPTEQQPAERPRGVPSNPVYARVGEPIKKAAHQYVQKGMNPHDIIRELAAEHGVHLNVGELRLLLAGRRVPESSDKT